jgi:hypothetical protein
MCRNVQTGVLDFAEFEGCGCEFIVDPFPDEPARSPGTATGYESPNDETTVDGGRTRGRHGMGGNGRNRSQAGDILGTRRNLRALNNDSAEENEDNRVVDLLHATTS